MATAFGKTTTHIDVKEATVPGMGTGAPLSSVRNEERSTTWSPSSSSNSRCNNRCVYSSVVKKGQGVPVQSVLVPLTLLLLLLSMMDGIPSVTATIQLRQFNRTFESLPGLFGGKIHERDPPVLARLTLIADQPFMCPDELKRIQPPPSRFYNSNNNNGPNNGSSSSSISNYTNIDNYTKNESNGDGNGVEEDFEFAYNDIEKLEAPEDGLPIALLVERGMCTFYEKAVMASKYGNAVKYVIVYDDEVSTELVPMSSEFTTNMTLLFVSSLSGQEIRNFIVRQKYMSGRYPDETNETEVVEELGIFVEIDGISPIFDTSYPALNMAAYFLAAMSGFLAFLIFFGCLLICAQLGWITAAPDEHGRIVLFAGGPGIRVTNGVLPMVKKHLLTQEQVMKLDEEEYDEPVVSSTSLDDSGGVSGGGIGDQRSGGGGGEESSDSCCCAICLDEFEPKEKIRILPCKHRFHEPCLIPWLTERHASCPLCKFDVLEHIVEKEKDEGVGDNDDDTTNNTDDKNDDRGTTTAIEVVDGSSEEDRITTMRNGGDGEGEVSNVSASRASSPVRSVWHRLRGWTLISNGFVDDTEDDTTTNNNNNNEEEDGDDDDDDESRGQDIDNVSMSSSISEIEMENRRIMNDEDNV